MSLSPGRVEALVWVLIYGGMLGAGLGIALARGGQGFGWSVVGAGIGAVLAGVILIWLRSRMHASDEA